MYDRPVCMRRNVCMTVCVHVYVHACGETWKRKLRDKVAYRCDAGERGPRLVPASVRGCGHGYKCVCVCVQADGDMDVRDGCVWGMKTANWALQCT